MLSYRHAFHAGNHADVLKHIVLIEILNYLHSKEKPFWYIDTHAGAGRYTLDHGYASQNAEHAQGAVKIWQAAQSGVTLPPLLEAYVQKLKAYNTGQTLRAYPGSPSIARAFLNSSDQMRLFELHSSDYDLLSRYFKGDPQVKIERQDGFANLKAILPPPPRRALTLIDPAYENKQDYQIVVKTLQEALKRFATGIYLVWYPILQRDDARRLPEKLKTLDVANWLNVELAVSAAAENGFGMHGSGLFIINPPWTLPDQLKSALPELVSLLKQDRHARFKLDGQIV